MDFLRSYFVAFFTGLAAIAVLAAVCLCCIFLL